MNVAKSSTTQNSFYNKEMTNPKDCNSLFSELDGFSFGVGVDSDKDKYFCQKDRIFILNKVINEFINIDWLKDEKYVIEYSGLHNYGDLKIIDEKICKLS